MSIYTVRFCQREELSLLQEFIDKHWRKGHILSRSKELFEFQHDYPLFDYYTFAIAFNNETSEIDAALGLIKYWKYDDSHTIPNAGWSAIWKVRDDVENPEVGGVAFKLLKFLLKKSDINIFASLGISQMYKSIAVSMHFDVGEMAHYYIANPNYDNFKVIVKPEFTNFKSTSQLSIIESSVVHDVLEIDNSLNPFKNITYLVGRYEKHPMFNYVFWKIYDDKDLVAIIVVRKIDVLGHSIYRIMDMLGQKCLNSIYDAIITILERDNAEYVDCLNHGLPKEFFCNLGFIEVNHKKGTIIPEHLSPLEHKYIPLEYAYISDTPLVIFKGDGDQDRPN